MGPQEFDTGLMKSEKAVNQVLNNLGAHLGLDHDRVLAGRSSLPVLARYLATSGGALTSAGKVDKLLYWYVNSFIWGRYAGTRRDGPQPGPRSG